MYAKSPTLHGGQREASPRNDRKMTKELHGVGALAFSNSREVRIDMKFNVSCRYRVSLVSKCFYLVHWSADTFSLQARGPVHAQFIVSDQTLM